ncbi:MAG: type II toxin-antitoxin system HipA family toxin [Myxococcaceae bacterium]
MTPSAIDTERALVFRDLEEAGTLTRVKHGAVFEYTDAFWSKHAPAGRGIAVHLPCTQRRHEIRGSNLHPFFAGLLPEGIRLRALLRSAKTSEDDLFSLLIAGGSDTVGDVAAVLPGHVPVDDAPTLKAARLEDSSFAELLAQSLSRIDQRSDAVVPGVQEKISASMVSFPVGTLSRRAAYILKLNPADKPGLVENEHFFMRMAKDCGLSAAETKLVRDRDGATGLLVSRFDRRWSKAAGRLERVHQEDGCQLLDRYPADKYRIPTAELAEALSLCAAPLQQRLRLVELLTFSWLICNGDLHAKNVSVIYQTAISGYELSPAYDLISTLPYGDRRMALKLDGKDDGWTRALLVRFAERFGVSTRAVKLSLDRLCDETAHWTSRLDELGLPAKKTADLRRTMDRRRGALGPRK